MPKVKSAKNNRTHIQAASFEDVKDEEKTPKPKVTFDVPVMAAPKPLSSFSEFKNPFGDVKLDVKSLMKQVSSFHKSQLDLKATEKKESKAVRSKEFKDLVASKKERRQQKREALHGALKKQQEDEKKKKNQKSVLNDYKSLNEALYNLFSDDDDDKNENKSCQKKNLKKKNTNLIDPLKLKNVPKFNRKKRQQERINNVLALRKTLQAKEKSWLTKTDFKDRSVSVKTTDYTR